MAPRPPPSRRLRPPASSPVKERARYKTRESGVGFAHYVEDVAVGGVVCAEEIVLAAGFVEGCEYFGIVGVLFSQLLDAALGGLVVVIPPVTHREDEAVHPHVSCSRNAL